MAFRDEFRFRVARPALIVNLPNSGYVGQANVDGLSIRWGFASSETWMFLRLMSPDGFSPEQVQDMIFVMESLGEMNGNIKLGGNVVRFQTFVAVNDPEWRLW